jgi:hypothetical protein
MYVCVYIYIHIWNVNFKRITKCCLARGSETSLLNQMVSDEILLQPDIVLSFITVNTLNITINGTRVVFFV